MDVINVIFDGIDIVDFVHLDAPTIDVVFEGEPGKEGPPGPAVNPYVYFDDDTDTWPARPNLTTVVWVGSDVSNPPTEGVAGVDLWVRQTV